ncbi:hypothetical protein [Kitasatospora sp. NPDC059327]
MTNEPAATPPTPPTDPDDWGDDPTGAWSPEPPPTDDRSGE